MSGIIRLRRKWMFAQTTQSTRNKKQMLLVFVIGLFAFQNIYSQAAQIKVNSDGIIYEMIGGQMPGSNHVAKHRIANFNGDTLRLAYDETYALFSTFLKKIILQNM
jgi:hypothetical protein